MSKINTFEDLFVLNLRDLYSAEKQLVKALPKVVEAANATSLKSALSKHLKETEGQVLRIENICEMLDKRPGGHVCVAMKGLIEEVNELIEDVTDPKVLDAALIGAAQKVEHYEISGYGTARTFAMLLGHSEEAKILQLSLNEEAAANQKLTEIAEFMVNDKANVREKVAAK